MIQTDLTPERKDGILVGSVEGHLIRNQKLLCFLLHQQGHSLAAKKKGSEERSLVMSIPIIDWVPQKLWRRSE